MAAGLIARFRSIIGRKRKKAPRLGLALGGGGAKGLAHIPILELLDEMGVKPCCISGTSIGAVLGALYASGMSGSGIRGLVDDTVVKKGDSPDRVMKHLKKMVGFMDLDLFGPGIFKGSSFMDYFYEAIRIDSFQDLKVPLKVVATDFWTSGEVVISSGDLIGAVKASMGLPGVFTPVEKDGMVLIDGGGVDPVPWSVLEGCDVTVAVDVLGSSSGRSKDPPSAFRAVMEMFDIMQRSIVAARMNADGPDIYLRPDIRGVGIMEFHRADEVYASAGPARDELESRLKELGF